MRILVTAFDAFGTDTINPASLAMRALPPHVTGAQIISREIPTVFRAAIDATIAAIDAVHPDAVVCLGQAGGRAAITPERIAINIDDARIPDNSGAQPIDQPIAADGPAAYFSTLPVKAMVQRIRAAGLPAELSNTAGTFVCNHLMYGVLHHFAGTDVRAGFVHVPYLPEQVAARAAAPSLPVADTVRGLVAALEAIVEFDTDLPLVEGATH